jgi:cytosine/adenosine deaminase-related metal-dependent hydrolase
MDSFKIIANAHVITCDSQNRAGQYNLLVRDNRIMEISDRLDLFTSIHPYATVIDASKKLIIPGFVNAHFHSESVLLRARTDGLHSSAWKSDLRTQECIKALLNPLSLDDVRNVYLMSYFSHLKCGTTCVGEFGLPFSDTGFNQMLQAMDRTEVKNIVALQNWDQIAKAGSIQGRRHRFLVSLGKAEEFTVYSFENLIRAASEQKLPLIVHVGEQRSEIEFIKKAFQKNIVAVLQDFNVVSPETVFVHLNHMNQQEIKTLNESGASVVLCARSAAQKRSGYPSLRHLAGQRMRLAVGTDWGKVDVLEELKFLNQLHLLISGIPRFSPLQLLRMGTINGASALGVSEETGSIEPGKKADLAFFSIDDMRLPVVSEYADAESLAALLVNHLTNRDVTDVMIDGEFYVAKGQVMTMAEDEVVEGFRTTYAKFFHDEAKKMSLPSIPVASEGLSKSASKILPFTPSSRSSNPPDEGFESGFEAGDELPTIVDIQTEPNEPEPHAEAPQVDPPRQDERASPKRDQSKGTWLTFGEDEDF